MQSLPSLRARSESFSLSADEIACYVGETPGVQDNDRIDYVISVPDMTSALLINRLRPGADIEVLSRRGGRRAYLFAFDAAHEDRLLGFLPFTIVLTADPDTNRPLYEVAVHDLVAAEPTVLERAATALCAGMCRTVVEDLDTLRERIEPEVFRLLTYGHSINTHVMADPGPIVRLCERIGALVCNAVEVQPAAARNDDIHRAA